MEILAERLDELIKCDSYHEPVPEWGERAWIARGKLADVIYWDIGNSWCDIMHVFAKREEGRETWLRNFFKQVAAPAEEENA